ncbi:MAG: hypothetical protein FJ095_13850 [Deltaproteobacteria bacterium]|nr:hypothetical protein [Deltaproteobacteria bacterium]
MRAPTRIASSVARVAGFLVALAALLVACRYDPVIDQKVRKNPPEDPGGPSPEHRAGQACVDCHSTYEGAEPALAIGGTVYSQTAKGYLNGVEGVFVTIQDSAGATYKACTNKAGNFYITKADLQGIDDLAFPLVVNVAGVKMASLIGRERSCAGCHKLASIERIDIDPYLDPATGRARDSAGAIIIDPEFVPSLERCGPPPDPTTSGAGGQGGAAPAGAGGATPTGAGGAGSVASSSTTGAGGGGGSTSSGGGMGAGGGTP